MTKEINWYEQRALMDLFGKTKHDFIQKGDTMFLELKKDLIIASVTVGHDSFHGSSKRYILIDKRSVRTFAS